MEVYDDVGVVYEGGVLVLEPDLKMEVLAKIGFFHVLGRLKIYR